MADSHVPDGGVQHPDAGDGNAFNGEVGRGLSDLLVEILSRQPGEVTTCDLGCGNGFLAGRLGQLGQVVTGVDASPSYVEMARRHHGSDRVRFQTGLIDAGLPEQLLASHPPFDWVVSADVIEHMYDPLALVKAAYAILRPGGTAVICTPYHGYLKNVAISVLDRWDSHHGVHWHGGHIKFFSVPSLAGLMREAGFNEPHFNFYGRFPGFWKNMIAVATKPEPSSRL